MVLSGLVELIELGYVPRNNIKLLSACVWLRDVTRVFILSTATEELLSITMWYSFNVREIGTKEELEALPGSNHFRPSQNERKGNIFLTM